MPARRARCASGHGRVISGTLVGGRDYFDATAREAGDAVRTSGLEGADTFEEYFRSRKDMTYPEPENDEPWETSPPTFIHLADARFTIPGAPSIPDNVGRYWRGRLNRADGFSLGSMTLKAD